MVKQQPLKLTSEGSIPSEPTIKKPTLTIFLALLALLGLFFLVRKGPTGSFIFPVFSSSNQPFSNLVEERFSLKQPLNLLLLGFGGGNHDGSLLTDSIILAQIDPHSHTATFITIPRDTWVTLGNTEGKINSAYSIGSGSLAKDRISALTGLPVDKYVALDFSGFVQFIDTLGGVDITLDKPFDDYAYPVDGQETAMCGKQWDTMTPEEKTSPLDLLPTVFPCRFEHLHLDAGLNHLDGTTALKFVRSRHSLTDGTDFGRSNRQRQLISAVIKKTFSLPSLPKAIPLYQSLKNHIDTDLSTTELASVVSRLEDLKTYQLKGIALTNQNILMDSVSSDGQFILVPTSGPGQWDSVHRWIGDQLNPPSSPSASLH